jgi:adenylate cyclase
LQRRLAAILAADVVGYSKLMGEDEAGTLAALRQVRQHLLAPAVEQHRGGVVKSMGDGWLVEFPSAADAVTCAIQVQDELSDNEIIHLRIGLHIGDVTFEDEDIYGDGVNTAARLQELAQPGAIVISSTIRRSIDGKLAENFADLGPQNLKNISDPITAFGRGMDGIGDNVEQAAPTLSEKPSIAVLPFVNMSGDPEQEYFADGMTEDIITALSRFHQFFVTARNSSFNYKGKSVDVKQAAGELGVQYVIEGSVRTVGNRARITAQLIDAVDGHHIWAERYDRELDDIFAVQDEITAAIVAAIEPNISRQERERAQRIPPSSLDTWGQYQRGLAAYYATNEDGLAAAIEIFDRVNELEPQFQAAFAMAAEARVRYVMFYSPDDRTVLLAQAREKAQRGISLEPGDPICLLAEGRVNVLLGHLDLALLQINEAIALNPNYAMAEYVLGWALFAAAQYEEAITRLDNAIRLSPHDAFLSGFQHMRARALFALQRFDECVKWERRATRSPNAHYWAFVTLAAALFKLDRESEALDAVADLLRLAPHFSLSFFKSSRIGGFNKEEPLDDTELVEAFRDAGVPE